MKVFLFFLVILLPSSLLAQGPPPTFQHMVTYQGQAVTVDFTLHSVRGPNFAVSEQQAGGALVAHTPGPVRTYIGAVPGHPGAIAGALIREGGAVLAHVLFETGRQWMEVNGTVTQRYVAPTYGWPDFVPASGGSGAEVFVAEVGIDLDYEQFTASGGTTATALEMAEFSVLVTNLVYLRDASIEHQIERVISRSDEASDPYAGLNGGEMRLEMKRLWNDVLPAGHHDVAAVVTDLGFFNGWSSVATIGDPGYTSVGAADNGDFSIALRLLLGYQWGFVWTAGGEPEGETLSSENFNARLSGPELELIRRHRVDRASHLLNTGNYGVALPPRASIDHLELETGSGPERIDVLDNDHDANGHALTLLSVDPVSAQGVPLSISTGTGPGGRDEILYHASSLDHTTADDSFLYRIQDSSGQEAFAPVLVRSFLRSTNVWQGHWTFDQAGANTAFDRSSHQRHGTIQSGGTKANDVLVLDGVNAALDVPGFDILTNTLTLSAWMKRDGDQVDFAGLIFARDSTTVAGLNLGENHELRYHWNRAGWDFDSGLTVPDGVWCFVAMVTEPHQTTLYLDSGDGLQSAVNPLANAPLPFDESIFIGRGGSNWRHFKGEMDSIQIHSKAMTATEVAAISTGATFGGVAQPMPQHLSDVSIYETTHSWESDGALNYRLYFSSTYEEVRDGTPGSAADQGLIAGSNTPGWTRPSVVPGQHYWRVDSLHAAATYTGPIWVVNIMAEPDRGELLGHWCFEDLGSTTQVLDSSAYARHADIGNATKVDGRLVLDGEGKTPRPAPIDQTLDRMTMTAWIKRDGPQSIYTGLLFTRGPERATGFNLGDANELRYHWNSEHFTLSSGLTVPDGVWTFVALVVEPERTRFYLDSGSGLQTAEFALTNVPTLLDGVCYIGTDTGGARTFIGEMDDVRIYSGALSAFALAEVQAGHAEACQPYPRHQSTIHGVNTRLRWLGANTQYRLYYGTDEGAVTDATVGSAVDQGILSGGNNLDWTTPNHAIGTSYYWRIDAVHAGHEVPGPVWQFDVASAVPDFSHWMAQQLPNAPAADRVFTADPDADGLASGLEYYLGFVPSASERDPTQTVYDAGTDEYVFTFDRAKGISAMASKVFWTTDLDVWHDAGAPVVIDSSGVTHHTMEKRVTAPAGERFFVELHVSESP